MTPAQDEGNSVGRLLQAYFSEHLIAQRDVSPATVRSYRDTFKLLLAYTQERTSTSPANLSLREVDAPLVVGFLAHLERDRGNSARSRNARLAAIHSFLTFAAARCPTALPSIGRVQAIPMKRFDRPLLGFLSREEVTALLAAPDRSTWSGQRDHAMLATLYNTGARVSEITGARVADLSLHAAPSVRIHGKGRKDRAVPLWPSTCRLLRRWIRDARLGVHDPVFPNRHREAMSRSGVEKRLALVLASAVDSCPSLRGRRASPHTLRHTTAMHLLQAGVDITVIALWLGHENPVTTHQYVEADLAMKRRALAKVSELRVRRARVVPSDAVLAFLDGL